MNHKHLIESNFGRVQKAMKTKSASQIQAEIDMIRIAYRQRQDAFSYGIKDFLKESVPYLITGTVAAGAIAFIIAALFTLLSSCRFT